MSPSRRSRGACRALALFLATAAAACASAATVGGGRSADEREIYRLLIEDQSQGPNGAMLVLEDSMTDLRRDQIRRALDGNPDLGFTPEELAAIEDLLEAGREAPLVPLDLGTQRRYEVGDSTSSADARDVLFVSGFGWSPERDHVVVHVDFFCSGCGWGGLTFFRRDPGGAWTLEGRRWMWKS